MLDLLAEALDAHENAYKRIAEIRGKLATMTADQMADAHGLARKCAELHEDTRKEYGKLQDVIGVMACMMLVERGDGQGLKGHWFTGYGKVSTGKNIPSYTKEPEKYAKLCAWLGVECSPLTRIHFPALQERLTAMLSEGQNLPEELAEYKEYPRNILVTTERADSPANTACAPFRRKVVEA